jgi:D-amino-acid dehydrogenase
VSRINIVGGGVVGLSSAIVLARAGHEVLVLEPDSRNGSADYYAASWGNAGHIAVEQVAPLASPATLLSAWKRRFAAGGAMDLPPRQAAHWLPFALRFVAASSSDRFEDSCDALRPLLAASLPAWQRLVGAIGRPELLKEQGHLVAWESEASATRGRAAWAGADTGTASFEEASAADVAAIRALSSSPVAGAIRFRGSAQIADLGQLADALESALLAAGGQILRERASVAMDGARAVVPGHPADLVLVAAGARSAPLVAPAGLRAPLIAERGYHIRGDAAHWPADMPPLVFEDRSMIVTRYANRVQAASFVEFGDPDAPADPRKWARLEAHVAALGLPIAGPFERWMGARPTLPDYLPAIGRSVATPNLLYAFGHQHLGLTLAAVTAELVVALADGAAPPVPLKPFNLSRFGGRS